MGTSCLRTMRVILCLALVATAMGQGQMDSQGNMGAQMESSNKGEGPKRIEGQIKLNKFVYKSICECVKPKNVTASLCRPTKKKIKMEDAGQPGGIAKDQIRDAIGNPQDLHFVKAKDHHFSCLDSRTTGEMMGTPGGDAGEFILALSQYENLINRPLQQSNVDIYFTDFLKSLKAAGSERKFYMCTDEQAVDNLQKSLKMEDISLTTAPTRVEPKELLEKLALPENIGSTHLRYMAKYPEKYNIRPELIKMFFNAFFKVLWNADSAQKNDLKLEVLKGERGKERAFVDIATTKDCVEEGLTPMMTPKVGANPEDGFFLLSLQGVGVYRNQLARFFAGKSHNMIDASTMKSRLNHHGRSYLEMSAKYMAKGLPFYTVYIV